MSLNATINVIELVEKDNNEMLDVIFDYRITEICLPIFNTYGNMRKCSKSKLIEMLHFVEIYPLLYMAIIDMGHIWRLAIPSTDSRDKGDGTEYTW